MHIKQYRGWTGDGSLNWNQWWWETACQWEWKHWSRVHGIPYPALFRHTKVWIKCLEHIWEIRFQLKHTVLSHSPENWKYAKKDWNKNSCLIYNLINVFSLKQRYFKSMQLQTSEQCAQAEVSVPHPKSEILRYYRNILQLKDSNI